MTWKIQLSDSQEKALGLTANSEKIGCGEDACVYAVPDGVVKVTHDAGDALACWLVAGQKPQPQWIVPVHVVWRLKSGYAIKADRVEKLPASWGAPIDELYEFTDDDDETDSWENTYEAVLREISWREAEHRGPTEADRRMRQALEAVNEGVKTLARLGFIWEDWHSDNWGLLRGKPVIIDLGRIDSIEGDSIPKRAKEIPILPY
jgi:hypothetical protein